MDFEPKIKDIQQTLVEKIYDILLHSRNGATSTELFHAVITKNHTITETFAEKVLFSLLGRDPNFVFDSHSRRWCLKSFDISRLELREAVFTVIDIETVGLGPGPGRIIELGACRVAGKRVTATFESLIRPEVKISKFVARMTGITDALVAQAQPIEKILPDFRSFLGDSIVVAHNAYFDVSFLDYEFRRVFRIGLKNPVICTVRLARLLLPGLASYRLQALGEYLGLPRTRPHRALPDAQLTAWLLVSLLEEAERKGFTNGAALLALCGRSKNVFKRCSDNTGKT